LLKKSPYYPGAVVEIKKASREKKSRGWLKELQERWRSVVFTPA